MDTYTVAKMMDSHDGTGVVSSSDPFRLDGRRVLVTGAARGLGAAIADVLVRLGAHVIGTARRAASVSEIEMRQGMSGVSLELEDISAFEDLVASVDADLLVNNAGINAPTPAVEVTPEQWDAVLGTNLRGTFFLTQAFARRWITDGTAAAVVSVSSQAGSVALPDRVVYGTSKAGVDQMTRSLAAEWAPFGIRVNAVAPTFVRTEMTAATLAQPARSARLLARIPRGRFGEPEEVAAPVAFLLGDAASLITGHTLFVDGGYTIT